ncbi:MAG: acyl-CoA dehydratase activase [Myxococcota bacterium]
MSKVAAFGIDAGSTTVKLAAVGEGGQLLWHRIEETEPDLGAQTAAFIRWARDRAGVGLELPLSATGYGRNLVDGAAKKVTEITCHAAGVFRYVGHGGTLIDVGGQDTKVIIVGGEGRVLDFAMNDKCAAGTGRFLEVCASRLRFSLGELGSAALSAGGETPISSTCTVFAESEIISLIARGHPVPEIVRGIFRSMLKRVVGLARSAGIRPPVMLSGGVARGEAFRTLLAEELGMEVEVPALPQIMGAYGAALLAANRT